MACRRFPAAFSPFSSTFNRRRTPASPPPHSNHPLVLKPVLCPQFRAELCAKARGTAPPYDRCRDLPQPSGFYALGVGLGFATRSTTRPAVLPLTFLCPRFRAGLCDRTTTHGKLFLSRFRAGLRSATCRQSLQAHRWFLLPSVSGWALRPRRRSRSIRRRVSMPSVSGWALRPRHPAVSALLREPVVSMPSVSGWALRRQASRPAGVSGFYALGVGHEVASGASLGRHRFYALGFGLGFATDAEWRVS